jgi:hypothetical protein
MDRKLESLLGTFGLYTISADELLTMDFTGRPALDYGTTAHTLTWRELVRREPRLAELLQEARTVDDSDPHFCANAVWYGYNGYAGLKGRLCQLVGWDADTDDPILRTPEAYDLAYDTIYDALPPCRHCGCLRIG